MNLRRNIELFSFLQLQKVDCSLLDQPYITCVDAEQEFIVIYNPRNEYFPLDQYRIADGKMHHTFKFPRRCRIPPRTEYCIYTCPGAANFDHGSLMEYHVLWTNHDGSLRRMEVLNNDKCCVKLINPKGEIVSQCEAGLQNPQAAERRRLEELRSSPFYVYYERVQVAMLYLRVVALVGMAAACVAHSAAWFVLLFWVAMIMDLLSRSAIGRDAARSSIALLGDRISTLVLTCSLLFLLSAAHSDASSTAHSTSSDGEAEQASTPAIRLGAVAYYSSAAQGDSNTTLAADQTTSTSAMAWVGMFVPGLARRTLWASLILELLATVLNPTVLLCPVEEHFYGSANAPAGATADIQEDELAPSGEAELRSQQARGVEDTYGFVGQLSPVLLTALGVAAEYYPVHCFTSYHYEYALGAGALLASPDTALWLYDLWVCAAAAGCLAYNVKLLNNASLVATGVMKLLQKR